MSRIPSRPSAPSEAKPMRVTRHSHHPLALALALAIVPTLATAQTVSGDQRFTPVLGQGTPLFPQSPQLQDTAALLQAWPLVASGTEGYRTAEVTLGGVDTAEVSSSTMESKRVPGLHFVGEVLDVTGWLGGYNFQWAWASGHAAGGVV